MPRIDFGHVIDRWFNQGNVMGPDPSTPSHPFRRTPFAANHWFVASPAGMGGNAGNDGRRPDKPLLTIASAIEKAKAGDFIHIVGNFTEEVTIGPELEDLTIIGESGRPRHADHARDSTFGSNHGASWRDASSPAGPLVIVRAQGVRFENILFVPPTLTYPAIKMERNALSGTSEYDASHMQVVGCRFAGGLDAINDEGGCFNVLIEDCKFHEQTGISIETTSTSVAVPLQWTVKNNIFINGVQHIRVSANYWTILNNVFGVASGTYYVNLQTLSAQGQNNEVHGNYLYGDYDAKYLGGANDEWAGNYSMDTASGEVGAEGLTTAAPVA